MFALFIRDRLKLAHVIENIIIYKIIDKFEWKNFKKINNFF